MPKSCGVVAFEAFKAISSQHNFPWDFPSPEVAVGLMKTLLSHRGFYSVIAEQDGAIVGSNFVDERGAIVGIGPITRRSGGAKPIDRPPADGRGHGT